MAIPLRQSTASQEIPLGYFVDSTDGNTEETGLTIANTDIKLWKAGATTLANKNSGGATHISNGIYYAVLDATDTDTLGPLVVFVHVAGALAVRVECIVLAANVYDSLVAGSDALQVHANEITAGLITAAAIATGAVDADALAADAVAEIADGVWDEALAGHAGAGSAGAALSAAGSGASAADIADAICDELLAGHTTAGSLAKAISDILADTGTDGVTLSTAVKQGIADEVLKRGVSNVEDAADVLSLAALILAAFKSSIANTTWTIKKSDGVTTFATPTVTVDANADPITGVS